MLVHSQCEPGGLGCTIEIDSGAQNTTYVTSAEATYWSFSVETRNAYWNSKLNLTALGGSWITWIWKDECLSMNETECIDDYSATFTFSLGDMLSYPSSHACQSECAADDECDGWVYRFPNETVFNPECYLKATLPIDLEPDERFITGLNITSDECDCICDDCYPETSTTISTTRTRRSLRVRCTF